MRLVDESWILGKKWTVLLTVEVERGRVSELRRMQILHSLNFATWMRGLPVYRRRSSRCEDVLA